MLNGTDNVTINCIVQADPTATMTWLFNEQLLYFNETIKYTVNKSKYILTIHNIRVEDNGVYTCIGSNVFGSINSTSQLSVQGNNEIITFVLIDVLICYSDDLTCVIIFHVLDGM